MLSPLRRATDCVPPACSGTDFIDMTEFEVLGGQPNALPTGLARVSNADPAARRGGHVHAASFTDPDSAITGYDWDFDGNGTVDRTTDRPTTDFAYGTPGSFTAKVAAKDFRGGAGNASTGVTVAPPASGPPRAARARHARRPRRLRRLGPLPSLTLPSRGTARPIRPSVRCALRCTVRAKLAVSKANGPQARAQAPHARHALADAHHDRRDAACACASRRRSARR